MNEWQKIKVEFIDDWQKSSVADRIIYVIDVALGVFSCVLLAIGRSAYDSTTRLFTADANWLFGILCYMIFSLGAFYCLNLKMKRIKNEKR